MGKYEVIAIISHQISRPAVARVCLKSAATLFHPLLHPDVHLPFLHLLFLAGSERRSQTQDNCETYLGHAASGRAI